MTSEAPKQQGNSTRENIKKAAMTDSSASSDRRHRVFTIHQRSQRLKRFRVFLLKDCMFSDHSFERRKGMKFVCFYSIKRV